METTYEFRSRSISTKVTEEQFVRYTEAAGADGVSLSEWVRDVLDTHVARAPFEQKLMEQLWALRYIVINAFPHIAPDQTAAADEIHKLIAEADEKKVAKATALLKATR